MEVTAKKLGDESEEETVDIEVPSTPKKKPKYRQHEPVSTKRIKKISQTKQKESVSLIYLLLVFLWIVVCAFTIFMALQTKIRAAEAQAEQEILQCKSDYQANRCLSPVKGLISFCAEKLACFSDTAVQRVTKSLSYSKLFGEIWSEFVQGTGFIGLAVGIGLIGMCLKQKGKQKETVTIEFYDDK